MFEPSTLPRAYHVPPGQDFSSAFVGGLLARLDGRDPAALARVLILVNTRRTERRLTELLSSGPPRLLPRIVPIAELWSAFPQPGLMPPAPILRRTLRLTRVVHAILDRQPDLAPRSAAFDLAESVGALIDEMHEEGVTPDALLDQEFGELSAHWERSRQILEIVTRHFGPESTAEPSPAAHLDLLVTGLVRRWAAEPPGHPVIVAGSTGSRGTTFRLMQAVSRLPQGAVVLPGFDTGLPAPVWSTLLDTATEEHPQFRFARLLAAMGLDPGHLPAWTGPVPAHPRAALLSLALRPAPVSDQWIVEGPALGDLGPATEGLGLIEAPSPRHEALAIAIALRSAVARGQTAAVVSPNRTLTRRIAAALDRWGILPDDSAGEPLLLTAYGRLLRLAAELPVRRPTIETLLVILKHPLTHSASGRSDHLATTRALELKLRAEGHPFPGAADVARLLGAADPGWHGWLEAVLAIPPAPKPEPLAAHVDRHLARFALLVAGPSPGPAADPWAGATGAEALRTMRTLEREADHGGEVTAQEYADLLAAILARGEVREPAQPHPQVKIWGTLEARVQGADLVILAGLNEGDWPDRPPLDPWLSRSMRRQIGLTSPERRIGLSAHDFQQAAAAPRAILSRALHDGEAETVPSRWLSRLTNLLAGLPGTGRPALDAMRREGRRWLDLASVIDQPSESLAPAARPAPRPPASARPRQLSVTEIKTLIRDPYAVYARHILRLKPLDPLRPRPDRPLAGAVMHKVFENFMRQVIADPARLTPDVLMACSDAELAHVHWPGIHSLWRSEIERMAAWFVETERDRRDMARPQVIETKSSLDFPDIPFRLVGRPDRIDSHADGSREVIDYKSGTLPTGPEMVRIDRQLMLLAIMAEAGAFGPGGPVTRLTHVKIGRDPLWRTVPAGADEIARAGAELLRLLRRYSDEDQGYLSRRAMKGEGDYDHLARFGEWAANDAAAGEYLR